ncbi:RdgB/HAM1 family non-canonical purine NTP pyrophosphatase [Allopusillimonas soli]|uniref:dITP/XTP pyrophosphatase n=1 Tax=Allopusillimonas soli TaxID=659016 RepID=A0A853FAJ7_9BURK|nr:RdgB/HAM1 family non-canonical purine NTP pyrophosphatase [Allopusillimonas soli]NYT36808.1 RdgB/HAM1 family non-canonical purine NTP pyrophosphatase [Allopusillimonas soli]TEA75272.1 RdgB/HAM1 family non-canonical purine NTP pyrophosphatase [Allopusillimonas soli]
MTDRVVLASNNAGKLREFSAILAQAGMTMVAQGELGVTEAEEPHATFVENALAKARHASRHTGLPALADDSGLCVDALDGAPGVYSARFAALDGGGKSDAANNRKLADLMAGQPDRAASYVALLVYVQSPDDPTPIIAEGRWRGEILSSPRGGNGFGYDPLFYLPDLGCSAAELAPEEKNSVSHRAKALRLLLTQLQALRV